MNKSYLSFWIIIYIIYLIYIILNKYLKIKYKKEYSFNQYYFLIKMSDNNI